MRGGSEGQSRRRGKGYRRPWPGEVGDGARESDGRLCARVEAEWLRSRRGRLLGSTAVRPAAWMDLRRRGSPAVITSERY